MVDVTGSKSWKEELASLMEDTGIIYTGDGIGISAPAYDAKRPAFVSSTTAVVEETNPESVKDQIKGFAAAWGEMALELGKGLRDVVQQSLLTEDSYIVRKTRRPLNEISEKLRFINEYLPEDRHPLHAWSVIFFVFILAMAALNINRTYESSSPLVKKVYIPPPSAVRIQLPDGRYIAYHEIGVPPHKARFSVIAPHSFLSSRLGGMSSINVAILEEYGVRLVTYDLPGFGESDPHHDRNLTSSALDMLHLADAIGMNERFWVWGYSTGALHVWAALKYIPNRIAGAAMFAPFVNPYDVSMTKEEMSKTWENWTRKRKWTYYLARRFPKFLSNSYRKTFLSGKHGQINKWFSLSLGEKDNALIEQQVFEKLWHRDVEESIRQGSTKPFVEEAVLQVSNWGFSLLDIQVQKKCPRRSLFSWLNFMYVQPECHLTGFLRPIHIWQGMDDHVVPPSMTEYISRVLPDAVVHKLPGEGHFSYFLLCDECHRRILSTLFGSPQGPIEIMIEDDGENESNSTNFTMG